MPIGVGERGARHSRAPILLPRVLGVLPKNASAEQRIRALLTAYLTMSVRTLAKRAHVAESTASKWRGIVAAENTASVTDDQRQVAAQ